jgi:hypothetical protein
MFDWDENDAQSLGAIEDTLRVLARSAQQEQDQEEQHLFEQQLLEQDREATDEDEEAVFAALSEFSLSSRRTQTTGTSESTDSTSQDGASIGEDTTGARKFLQTLFPYL